MENSKTISIRVSKEVLKWFDHIAEELGVSRSELIKAMMLNTVVAYLYYRKNIKNMYFVNMFKRDKKNGE